jgi:hypothetical protein
MDRANTGGVTRKAVSGWVPTNFRPRHYRSFCLNQSGDHCSARGYEWRTSGRNDMSCERCGGLMVVETCCDLMETGFRKGIDTTRCVNCGNFEDAIIRTNRAGSRFSRQSKPRTAEASIQSADQLCSLERAIHTEPIIATYPCARAPRLPVGPAPPKLGPVDPY